MTEKKLRDYMRRPFVNPSTIKTLIPVVLSDSKGGYLKSEVSNNNTVEQSIIWWAQSSATIQDRITWLKENLHNKIRLLGNIHLYVWLGTCNLTTKDKGGFISLSPKGSVDLLMNNFREIIKLLASYPESKITILEVPIYSIAKYNSTHHHPDISKFADQDVDLMTEILELNTRIKNLNQELQSTSPSFNRSLYSNTKHRSQDRNFLTTRPSYNINLYFDGIHPKPLLARVWLRKLANQIKADCWM